MGILSYLIAAIALCGMLGGGFLYVKNIGYDQATADMAEKQAAADAKIKELTDKALADSANTLIDMNAAYEKGLADAKPIAQHIQARGRQDVANNPVFSAKNANGDLLCVLPDDSLHFLNGTLATMRTPTDPGEAIGSLPATGPSAGQQIRNPIPVDVGPSEAGGSVVGVHAEGRHAGSDHQVSGNDLSPHQRAKPKAVR